jgi:hypothetical protein
MKMVKVYPATSLSERREYLPGIGVDGAELPEDEANDLIERGLATKTKRSSQSFHPEPDNTAANFTATREAGAPAPEQPEKEND